MPTIASKITSIYRKRDSSFIKVGEFEFTGIGISVAYVAMSDRGWIQNFNKMCVCGSEVVEVSSHVWRVRVIPLQEEKHILGGKSQFWVYRTYVCRSNFLIFYLVEKRLFVTFFLSDSRMFDHFNVTCPRFNFYVHCHLPLQR